MSKRTLQDFAEMSVSAKGVVTSPFFKNYACDIKLQVDGEDFTAYEVSITYQDLLFFCDKGTANYVVDIYGGRVTCELFNWERD